MTYDSYSKDALETELSELNVKLKEWKDKNLTLDLTRGKPSSEQLALTEDMLGVISSAADCLSYDGTDCRNYGVLDGIPEAKELFSELLGIPESRLLVAGNSSLNIMFDTMARCMMHGVVGSESPWISQKPVKFLCPAPGYDRHFRVCQTLGIEMITIDMTPDGPDMDKVEELCAKDANIKGIWCCPKFSNPEGYTYSDETVTRLASMKCAAPDFRIFWDNAYAVHEFTGDEVKLLDIFAEAEKAGNLNRVFYFASTSKITFPGSGVAIMAASEANLSQIKTIMSAQTIGYDKINQMRHVKYFGNADGVRAHMKRHAEIIRPKFEVMFKALDENLTGVAEWTKPTGGYFLDLSVADGCAKRVFDLCASAGVKLTDAGATFPYGVDPNDRHLRIAPTYPKLEDLAPAAAILCLCVKIATVEKLLGK